MTKRWGPWRLSNDGQFLEYRWDDSVHDSALYRKLDLHRCTTAAEILDTIFHEAGRERPRPTTPTSRAWSAPWTICSIR